MSSNLLHSRKKPGYRVKGSNALVFNAALKRLGKCKSPSFFRFNDDRTLGMTRRCSVYQVFLLAFLHLTTAGDDFQYF